MIKYINLSGVSFAYPNGKQIFKNLNLTLNKSKIGIVGNNGSGKSTLLKLISKQVIPNSGNIVINGKVDLLQQDFTFYSDLSVADVLGIQKKLFAIERISSGKWNEEDIITIDDDWDITNRARKQLFLMGLENIELDRKLSSLSGGEAMRTLLTTFLLNENDFILMDEPTNHLDIDARNNFYNYILDTHSGMLIVSHDKKVLNLMNQIIEISSEGIKTYGGNYDFYIDQRNQTFEKQQKLLSSSIAVYQKQIRNTKRILENRKRSYTDAQSKVDNKRYLKSVLNQKIDYAEYSQAKIAKNLNRKCREIENKISNLKEKFVDSKKIKIDLINSETTKSKILVKSKNINHTFDGVNKVFCKEDLEFRINNGERIHLSGNNGTGKTTLINLISGRFKPIFGSIELYYNSLGLINQNYDLLDNSQSVLGNIQQYSKPGLSEGEIRIRLSRFLFFNNEVFKKVENLSGGEKARLSLACLLASSNSPDMIILDEPTNNLDIKGVEVMTKTLKDFSGCLIVVSHDLDFVDSLELNREIKL